MRGYYDPWDGGYVTDKTITVHELPRECIVKYPKSNGGVFKAKVRQKLNPIGFHARLPGDRK